MRYQLRVLISLSIALMAYLAEPSHGQVPANAGSGESMSNPALSEELIAMADKDQDVRHRWLADRNNAALQAEIAEVDRRNVARLKTIVSQYGWPGRSMVGIRGGGAAWVIAQHADPDFLHAVLPMMEAAAKSGQLIMGLYVTSLDRTLVQDGKKQRYGTQFDTSNGKCEPFPIEDPAHVDERRRAAGLPPLAEYRKQLCPTSHK